MVDRYLSVHTGRPFVIPDDSELALRAAPRLAEHLTVIDVSLPLDIDDATLMRVDALQLPYPRTPLPAASSSPSGNLACLRSLATLSRLYEQVINVLYSSRLPEDAWNKVVALDSVLTGILEELPAELVWNPAERDSVRSLLLCDPSARRVVQGRLTRAAWVASLYHQMRLLIYRSLISIKRPKETAAALPIALASAYSIAHIIDTLRLLRSVDEGLQVAAAFAAGIMIAAGPYIANDASDLDRALASLGSLIAALQSLAPRCVLAIRASRVCRCWK